MINTTNNLKQILNGCKNILQPVNKDKIKNRQLNITELFQQIFSDKRKRTISNQGFQHYPLTLPDWNWVGTNVLHTPHNIGFYKYVLNR